MHADRRGASRRGAVYIIVLAVAVVAMAVTVGALSAMEPTRESTLLQGDVAQAEQLAQSGVDLILVGLNDAGDWRTQAGSGARVYQQVFNGGTITMTISDPYDDDLSNGGPIKLIVSGEHGAARRTLQVTLTEDGKGTIFIRPNHVIRE